MALKLCPQAKVIKGDATHNCHIPLLVIQEKSHYRKASIDEFYLDITGMDRFGCYQWTNELAQRVVKPVCL
jgi:DNA polymerase-4